MTGITWVGMVSGVPYRWRVPVVAHDYIHDVRHDEREEKEMTTSSNAMTRGISTAPPHPAHSHIR